MSRRRPSITMRCAQGLDPEEDIQVETIAVGRPARPAERLCREYGEPAHIRAFPHISCTMRGACWHSTMPNGKVQEGNITGSDMDLG